MKFQTKYFIEDYLGKRINNLMPIAIAHTRTKDGSIKWIFQCICGKEVEETPYRVISGHRKSCGCMRYAKMKIKSKGFVPHKLLSDIEKYFYRKWLTIRTRCYNTKHEKYPIYGGRGIKMCLEWENNAQKFIDWCKKTYPGDFTLTIDRIDSNGLYSPENCRWATIKEQNRNRRNCVWIDFNGEYILLAELAERYNQDLEIVRARLKIGWSIEKALTVPAKHRNKEE